jgi:pimeloyl-ACP methyl ester carboxylesterase
METTLKQIDIGEGRRIGYREQGQGGAVLLLHGVGSGSLSYTEQLAGLSDSYRVIAWDAPGYGGSDDAPPNVHHASDFADDATRLLDALHIDTAHIVGHSMGGLIAAALIQRHAHRVDRVVLSSCASGYATRSETEREERLRARVDLIREHGAEGLAQLRGPGNCAETTDQATVDRVIDIMARVRAPGYITGATLLDSSDVFAHLRAWPKPAPKTLVMVGAHDRTTPPPGCRRIAHCISGSIYKELMHSAHAGYLEQPAEFNQLVREHLS